MSVIEFQTYVEAGTIEVPKQYRDQIKGRARVVIFTEDLDDDGDMVEYLLDHPYAVQHVSPLTRDEIYERR